ncbi:sulfoxide reductase heme-binding subunit YedZ [Chromobacterium vaccinii]|uniref:Protein-methionine-sulfoxide reductase heme-binding subunit MsrQ n=1 Tax=Chromobacterium vaccinii TaxID=1108595 RepID=A0ABV0FCS0_9NEIS|nr:protein-methionine-sulfoxide reductase heme-binding subunit MsrQ [Chromobacterium vaccinii]MCD4485067.1 sulfoxide reductase heme-binding subunit YedZ [Chromobacterium vaccinii]MCD4498293.1 sulfoxide reductase heme-binding subunit YedZ [Chromobacterium vaccinii]
MTTLRMKLPASAADRRLSIGKALLFIACLLPLARAAWIVLSGEAVNPVEFITRSTGTWTLVWLLATLSMTPLRRLSGQAWPLKCRRMLGLFAFFYASLHFTTYVWLDQFFDWHHILKDIAKRPFITVGFAAIVLMSPLALTSTQGWMRRLKRNWGKLHRLVYPVAILAVTHYWWLVKKDITQPLIYAAALAALLGLRLWWRARKA